MKFFKALRPLTPPPDSEHNFQLYVFYFRANHSLREQS